jgi:hypothetical protein
MRPDPFLPLVHHFGDLPGERAAFGVSDRGDLRGPRASRERDRGSDATPEPGADDAGDVAGSGQVPFADRAGQGLAGVQPGQFRSPQGALVTDMERPLGGDNVSWPRAGAAA